MTIFMLTFVGLLLVSDTQAVAQLFTPRNSQSGILRGNERFLRSNRTRRSFVGSDRTEQKSFVGSQQAIATGQVRPATEGLRIETTDTRRINRPMAPQPARGMYYPRLELDLDVPAYVDRDKKDQYLNQEPILPCDACGNQASQIDVGNTAKRIQERVRRVAGPNVHISVIDATAVVNGSVDSDRTLDLLTAMLEFEPGIDQIRNEVRVAGQSSDVDRSSIQ